MILLSFKKPKDMEISHTAQKSEHEAINKSLQTMSVTPFDSHAGSQKQNTVLEVKPGPPHEALFFVLAYLPLYELLAMSEVCMSFKNTVNNDVLPWLNIIVERPLNLRLSDEILMKITSKANGRLRILALINCVRITDDGLERVIEKNLFIRKLYLPGCTGLTPEGIIKAVKILSQHHCSLKGLKIYGIYNITKENLDALHSYLQMNLTQEEQQQQQPILYHNYRNIPTYDHRERNRAIDVEICPKCNEVRIVFDCPRETCKRKRLPSDCRGCSLCIPRCEECGVCVGFEELEEAVCADTLCSDCWLQLPKCNLCNKPYCRRHGNQQSSSSGSTGFVCDVCPTKFIRNSYDDDE